ncbi:MAG: hypothetical protein PWQ96_173 [Clostridia bacterium]|jgi:hypothetical protein|nr:hypothetical protein [Clostridia bacterium]
MVKKPKLRELIFLAKNGDEDAFIQVVRRFLPVAKKYSQRMGYEDAGADLVVWIVNAIHRYQPKTTWGRGELELYLSFKREKEN